MVIALVISSQPMFRRRWFATICPCEVCFAPWYFVRFTQSCAIYQVNLVNSCEYPSPRNSLIAALEY
jgi:hypothetical protein